MGRDGGRLEVLRCRHKVCEDSVWTGCFDDIKGAVSGEVEDHIVMTPKVGHNDCATGVVLRIFT